MSPVSKLDDPKYWRDRAEEMRLFSQGMHDSEAKRIMCGVVRSFEILASLSAQQLAAADGKIYSSTTFGIPSLSS